MRPLSAAMAAGGSVPGPCLSPLPPTPDSPDTGRLRSCWKPGGRGGRGHTAKTRAGGLPSAPARRRFGADAEHRNRAAPGRRRCRDRLRRGNRRRPGLDRAEARSFGRAARARVAVPRVEWLPGSRPVGLFLLGPGDGRIGDVAQCNPDRIRSSAVRYLVRHSGSWTAAPRRKDGRYCAVVAGKRPAHRFLRSATRFRV